MLWNSSWAQNIDVSEVSGGAGIGMQVLPELDLALNHYTLLPFIRKHNEADRVLEIALACERDDCAHFLIELLINCVLVALGK